MNARELMRQISSLAATAVALIGSSTAKGDGEQDLRQLVKAGSGTDTPPIEPLILKRAEVPVDPMLLARGYGHSSHSSHASHASHVSHASGSSGYIPPSSPSSPYVPQYVVPTTPRPYVPPSQPSYLPSSTPTPSPAEYRDLTRLEFKNGVVVNGYILSKSSAGISFQVQGNNKVYKFRREMLTDTTVAKLALPATASL